MNARAPARHLVAPGEPDAAGVPQGRGSIPAARERWRTCYNFRLASTAERQSIVRFRPVELRPSALSFSQPCLRRHHSLLLLVCLLSQPSAKELQRKDADDRVGLTIDCYLEDFVQIANSKEKNTLRHSIYLCLARISLNLRNLAAEISL